VCRAAGPAVGVKCYPSSRWLLGTAAFLGRSGVVRPPWLALVAGARSAPRLWSSKCGQGEVDRREKSVGGAARSLVARLCCIPAGGPYSASRPARDRGGARTNLGGGLCEREREV